MRAAVTGPTMTDALLVGRRILIAEDEFLLAAHLGDELEALGAQVLGPVPTIEEATALIDSAGAIDAALLDVNLGGSMVFPVADRLRALGVPFAFTTGYDGFTLPERFAGVPIMNKPFRAASVGPLVAALLRP